MSVGYCIISAMFKSYWYVCQSCDASIEVVSKGIHIQDPTCNCANSEVVWCQTNVIESDPTNERNKMETTSTIPYSYNPNLLVTYKSINDGEATFPNIKVVELESKLDSLVRLEKQLTISNGQIGKIIDNLTVEGWYNPNVDKEDILRDLCEILDHEAKQTVTISATVNVEVSYDIPLDEVEDFDAKYFLQDNLTIDSWHGDVVIESYDVEDADVNW
jgi:hypothetical protein